MRESWLLGSVTKLLSRSEVGRQIRGLMASRRCIPSGEGALNEFQGMLERDEGSKELMENHLMRCFADLFNIRG